MSVLFKIVASIVTLGLLRNAVAIKCYSTGGGLSHQSNFIYCAFSMPISSLSSTLHRTFQQTPDTFGLTKENEDLEVYVPVFAQNDDNYEVMSVCVFEKYRHILDANGHPVLNFRCLCNGDGCNRVKGQQPLIHQQQ